MIEESRETINFKLSFGGKKKLTSVDSICIAILASGKINFDLEVNMKENAIPKFFMFK